MRLLTWDEIVKIHDLVCPETKGVRHRLGFHPIVTDNFSKAKQVAKFHPFFDGNKRTAMMVLWIDTERPCKEVTEKIIKDLMYFHKKELELLKEV